MRPSRRRLWTILEPAAAGDRASRVFDVTISSIIILAIFSTIISEEPWLPPEYSRFFRIAEVVFVSIFCLEYLTRLYCCTANPIYNRPWGRLAWASSPMALIDLLAILPTILWFVDVNLIFLRVIRLLRLLRLGRYNRGMRLITRTFQACGRQLLVVASGLLVVLFVSAGVLNAVEREAQPETFGSFFTSMWWAICTLTTVGYGDLYPMTAVGRFCAALIAIVGIGAFALPSGIIAGNFNQILSDEHAPTSKRTICPHCGKPIDQQAHDSIGNPTQEE